MNNPYRTEQDTIFDDLIRMRDALRSGPTVYNLPRLNGTHIRSTDEIADLLERAILALSARR